MTRPAGQVDPATARKLLRAQAAAAAAQRAYQDAIRDAIKPPGSTRAVAKVLGISHPKVQRLAKPDPPTE